MHFIFIYFAAPGEALFSIWYYIGELAVIAIFFGCILSAIRCKLLSVASVIGLSAVIIFQIWYIPSFVERKSVSWAKLEVAGFIHDELPGDILGAMYDSGIVSYFSQRRFISLNGLIGDYETARLCKDWRLSVILEKYRITHVVTDFNPAEI